MVSTLCIFPVSEGAWPREKRRMEWWFRSASWCSCGQSLGRTTDILTPGCCACKLHQDHWLSQFSGLQVWTGTSPLAVLGLQLANGRLRDFSASIITSCGLHLSSRIPSDCKSSRNVICSQSHVTLDGSFLWMCPEAAESREDPACLQMAWDAPLQRPASTLGSKSARFGGWEVQDQASDTYSVWGEPASWFIGSIFSLCPYMVEETR
ncbi:PREDICTED: uncharacterized protein LOC105584688 [Cercocebus atys]|uniref:uncharacterized protein LOC105584688 n=1 Tax=Cercocebus atys TaxID=9531 RepID=UPI0005F504BC|nr:PREDICTED: uncharacterized protein LOC105584688 [Cercocebus atys]